MYVLEELTAADIGAQIGVTKNVVLRMLHDNGIALRPSGPTRPGTGTPLLDLLYRDTSICATLTRHQIPLAKHYGNRDERFPHQPNLTAELLDDLYNQCGISTLMISLLVGHGEHSIRSKMRTQKFQCDQARSVRHGQIPQPQLLDLATG